MFKNRTGSSTHIFDIDMNLVARYEYDAWGNHVATEYTEYNIEELNPIRYRGYYYDTETGLFSIGPRYYDPEIGRFINPDDVEVATTLGAGFINGLNLYAYCGNDPVNVTDSTGYFWDYVLDVVSIVWSIYDLVKNPSWENVGWLALDVVLGVIPFVPSIGKGIKGLTKIDDAIDIAKGINRIDNVHDTIVIGNGMTRVIGKADEIGAIYYHGYKPINALLDARRAVDITFGMKMAGRLDNAKWLMGKVLHGYNIVDIGRDSRSVWRSIKSAYGMERRLLFYWWHGGHLITRGIRLFG